jgi:hypothetical protein
MVINNHLPFVFIIYSYQLTETNTASNHINVVHDQNLRMLQDVLLNGHSIEVSGRDLD